MNVFKHLWRFLLLIFRSSPQIPTAVPPLPVVEPPHIPVDLPPVEPPPVEPPPVIEVSDPVPIPEPKPPVEPVPNGLRHDWRHARAAWLYPGDENWLASHRMMLWGPERIQQYLDHPEVRGQTHVIICCNTGTRPSLGERPFDGVKNPDTVRQVFAQVIASDKAPICWAMSQEFLAQSLDQSHSRLLDYLRETVALVADLCHLAVPFREIGDVYGGADLEKRNDVMKALRRGAPDLPLAIHERSLEQIPVSDVANVSGTIISALQTGFDTPTGGANRPQDRITHGSTTYDGAAGFIRANDLRMSQWQRQGRMEEHVTAVFEHSIPRITEGQTWGPTRDLASAIQRGRVLLQHGAAFDLSSGASL